MSDCLNVQTAKNANFAWKVMFGGLKTKDNSVYISTCCQVGYKWNESYLFIRKI